MSSGWRWRAWSRVSSDETESPSPSFTFVPTEKCAPCGSSTSPGPAKSCASSPDAAYCIGERLDWPVGSVAVSVFESPRKNSYRRDPARERGGSGHTSGSKTSNSEGRGD